MNTKVLAGALALGLWGGAALAQESDIGSSLNDPTTDETVVVPDVSVNVQPPPQEPLVVTDDDDDDYLADMRGMVTVGAGLEGYTGSLGSQINPGFAWGVTAAFKPLPVLGLELGYSGAVHELGSNAFSAGGLDASGSDFIRNGGRAVLTLGMGRTPVQPYVLGGIGIDWYNNRSTGTQFTDDVAGVVPLGGGIRGHIGHFTADARLAYNVLFSDEFGSSLNDSGPGSYTGTISLGGNF